MLRAFIRHTKLSPSNIRCCSTVNKNETQKAADEFESVFTFPFIKYISVINRLKVYQMLGTSVAIPSCGILEALNVLPSHACLSAAYIGLTGTVVLTLGTLPFRNTIGFLYVSKDESKVKISSMDFWGRRKDKTIPTDDWIPLLDLPPKKLDAFYLSPRLADGSQYKLYIKFGKVVDKKKMGAVLE